MNYLRYSCSHKNTKNKHLFSKWTLFVVIFVEFCFSNLVLWNKINNNEIVDMLQAYFGNNRNYYLQRNATWKPFECHAKCLEQNGSQFEQIGGKQIIVILLFVLLNKYNFHNYKNVFINHSWPVTNKVLLIPIRIRN
jgi:hypothetical protein